VLVQSAPSAYISCSSPKLSSLLYALRPSLAAMRRSYSCVRVCGVGRAGGWYLFIYLLILVWGGGGGAWGEQGGSSLL
jgi:hypothetical protein